MAGSPSQIDQLLRRAGLGRMTLVYGARDKAHNNAVVLRESLEEQLNDAASS